MAEHPPSFQFEDVPLDEARRMGRGPRMEPMLYDTLRKKIESLADQATRVHLGPEITQQRMRNYILHIARELGVPVTIRRVPGGLLFWRSSEEDMQQAQEDRQPLPDRAATPTGPLPRTPAQVIQGMISDGRPGAVFDDVKLVNGVGAKANRGKPMSYGMPFFDAGDLFGVAKDAYERTKAASSDRSYHQGDTLVAIVFSAIAVGPENPLQPSTGR